MRRSFVHFQIAILEFADADICFYLQYCEYVNVMYMTYPNSMYKLRYRDTFV
jgi:hypothetical protein